MQTNLRCAALHVAGLPTDVVSTLPLSCLRRPVPGMLRQCEQGKDDDAKQIDRSSFDEILVHFCDTLQRTGEDVRLLLRGQTPQVTDFPAARHDALLQHECCAMDSIDHFSKAAFPSPTLQSPAFDTKPSATLLGMAYAVRNGNESGILQSVPQEPSSSFSIRRHRV